MPYINALQQQDVNFHLFNNMTISKFATNTKCEVQHAHVMSWDEENAIRYAAGYVVNKLVKQYMKMNSSRAG